MYSSVYHAAKRMVSTSYPTEPNRTEPSWLNIDPWLCPWAENLLLQNIYRNFSKPFLKKNQEVLSSYHPGLCIFRIQNHNVLDKKNSLK